jgi:UDP-3-O-[3-hydroxymyristoyl] glucosamine N-acyltransferase
VALGAQTLEDPAAGRETDLSILIFRGEVTMSKSMAMTTGRTAGELAEFLGALLEGDAGVRVSGLASPESAGAEDLIYISSPRHLERAERSRSRCVLATREINLRAKTVLHVSEPKLAFAKAATLLLTPAPIAQGIHSSTILSPSARLGANVAVGPHAVIEEDVEIGAGTEIGAFCFVGRGARLGEECRLYPRVTLYAGARLGRRVVVHSGSVIGADGFGYVYGEGRHWKFPQIGSVEIGDDVEIGCNTTIDRGSLGATCIGAGVKIDNLVQVAHNVQVGEHSILVSQTGISGSSVIGKRVMIGGQAGLGEGCTIEDGAILGGQSGILPGKIIRSGQTVWGTPARPLERFKEQFAWLGRLPQLAERIRQIERKGKDS